MYKFEQNSLRLLHNNLTRPLSRILSAMFFLSVGLLHLQAQCPSPAATTTITSSIAFGGSTTTIPNSGTVTYVTGNVNFGTSILAYTITISGGTTWVVTAGSHLAVQNLNVLGTLIIQEGATVSVGSLMPTAIGSFNVNSGGIVKMCTNSGVENCGSTTFAETSVPALTYVGAAGGKAVAVFGYKPPYYAGNLTMPYGGASNSSNITIVADNPPAVNYLFNIVGSPGASPLVYKSSTPIANLPFNASLGCGGLFGQTADIDTDNDGIANSTDLDDDNDGILDTVEDAQLSPDTDGDGVPNKLDLDSDNDGINDVIETNGTDANRDGIADGAVSPQGIPSSAGAGSTPPDTDGDTRPNPYDLDSDNDGINDLVESGNPLLADANGDGQVDGSDPDNDGIRGPADAVPATRGDANDPTPVNTDGLTTPDYTDLDSDNDGLTDLAESGIPNTPALDPNGDGKIDNPADPDGDGIPQAVDGAPATFGDANNPTLPDANNNGTPDFKDPNDTDGDGIADATDLDDDNDGILDTVEDAQLSPDTDGDGVPNKLDLDSDNDGINDVIETNGTDANKDGIADGTVSPQGIPSSAGTGSTPPDTDGDTRPNPYDLDSDNDGINDLVESGNPLLADANGDGQVDGTDPDKDGILGAADAVPATRGDANDPTPVNTDGLTTPDYTDLDSDNDGLTDLAESGIPNTPALDPNGDGKIDNPADPDGDGIPQGVDGAPATFGDANNPTLPDANNNGTPDFKDPNDTDGDGIADATDLDDDNDGILDTVEDAQLSPDTDGDGVPNKLDLDSDNDGINDVIETNGTDANRDGIADGAVSPQGIPSSAGTGSTPPDTDGDTRPNPYDLDSDNDGINDLVESGNPLLADANGDGQVDGTDPDKDGILGAADAVPATRGDANDPTPVNTDGLTTPDYTDLDSDNDGLTDLAESGIPNTPALDPNGDGKIDNPSDPDGDGIPQGVDGAPATFGDTNNPALPDTDADGQPDYVDASAPAADLFPNYTFSNTTFNVGDVRDVIININEIKGNATTGQIQFFVPFSSGFTYTFNPTQSTSTVLTSQAVNNAAWSVTNTGTGLLFSSTQVIAGNGRSRIAISVKADVKGTDANITTNIVPLSGGETNGLNNIAVLAQSIQN